MMSTPFTYLEIKSHFDKKEAANVRRSSERPCKAEQERLSRSRLLTR